jgi:hypothetical protein
VYALTTKVQVLFNTNLGAYFSLIKHHLVPPRLVELLGMFGFTFHSCASGGGRGR